MDIQIHKYTYILTDLETKGNTEDAAPRGKQVEERLAEGARQQSLSLLHCWGREREVKGMKTVK